MFDLGHRTRHPAYTKENMAEFDYNSLRTGISTCVTNAYQQVRESCPKDIIYLFDLYTSEDVDHFGLQANTLDAIAGSPDPNDADTRWRPDCKHELSDHLDVLNDELNFSVLEELGFDDGQIWDHKGRVLATAVQALAALKNSGLFTDNPNGHPVVQICSITDSDWTDWLEKESSKRCNTTAELETYNAYWLDEPASKDLMYPSFIDELEKNAG